MVKTGERSHGQIPVRLIFYGREFKAGLFLFMYLKFIDIDVNTDFHQVPQSSRSIDISLQVYVCLVHNRGQFMLGSKQRATGGALEVIPVCHR